MADSMPICDVLSEAMEYLSKLGTNIRIRSENLRDKRIKKEKLGNTHAIHKAVDKVLLICERSKKSIENVETGVKNLLLQMEMAGSSFGPGPTTRDRSHSDVTFEYFTYQSRRLKIRNKISVEHYTSVKVVSTSMTIPMLEKYPVYHDCKLYRMRKKKKKKQIQSWLSEHGEVFEGSVVSTTAGTSLGTMEPNPTESIQICELTRSDNIIENSEDVAPTDSHKIKKNNKLDNAINSDTLIVSENKCVDEQSKLIVQDKSEMNSDDDKYESDFEVKHTMKKYKAKKMRHARILDDDSNSDKEAGGKNDKEEDSLNQKESKLCSDTIEASSTKHQNDQEKGENGGETSRPIIKCVSLSKLLKPEIAKSIDAESNTETRKSKTKDKHLERRQERLSRSEHKREAKYKRLRCLDTSDEDKDDNAYWACKRKEVKKFKAKNFDINLDRLPKITTSFLVDQNLKRITQNGDVVCEIKSEVCEQQCYNKKSNDSEPQPKRIKINNTDKNNSKQKIDIDKVRSSLLDDSDSDNIGTVQNKNLHQTTHGQMNNPDLGIADNMQDNTSVQEVSDVHGAEIVNNSEDVVCNVPSLNISSDCNESQDMQNCSTQEPQCNETEDSDKETACRRETNVKQRDKAECSNGSKSDSESEKGEVLEEINEGKKSQKDNLVIDSQMNEDELDKDTEKLDEIEAVIPKNTDEGSHRKMKNNGFKKKESSEHPECNDKGSTIIQRKDEDTKECDGIMEVKTTRHHKHHKPSHKEKQDSNNDHLDNSKDSESHRGTDNEHSNDTKNSTLEIPDCEVQKMEQDTQNDDKQKNAFSGEFDPDSPHKIKRRLGSKSYCNISNSELNQDEHTEVIRNSSNLEGSDSEPHKRKENEDNTPKKPFFGQADSENVKKKKDLVAVKPLSTFSESEKKTQNREQQNDVNTFKKSLNEKVSCVTPNIEKEHSVPDATESYFEEESSVTLEGQSYKNNTPVKDQKNKKPKVTDAIKKKKSHHNKSEHKGGSDSVKKSLHNEPGSKDSKGQKSSEVKKSLNESGCDGEKRQQEPNSLLNKLDCGRENGQDAEGVQKSLLNEFNRECNNIQNSEQSKKSLNGSKCKTDNILNSEELKIYHLNESDDKSVSRKSDSDSDKLQNAHEVKKSLLKESNCQDINIQNSDEVKKSRLYESDCGGDNIQDAKNVKKSLLNESDSESDKVQDVEEVKRSLLNESDSDCDKVQDAEVKKLCLNESDSDCDKVQDAEEVKKSLLNESDSDCNKVQDAEEVKKSLLNESDSDCFEVQDAEAVKKSLLNESNSDGEKVQDTEVKKSLLNESEDESDKVQNEEEIKKSLLNESEDESEKELNVEVKKSLLNECASERDKEQDIEKVKKSLLNESDCEGDKEQDAEEIKKSLLNESEDEGDKEQNAKEIKKSLLNESDCEGDKVQDAEEIKKSLLNESEAEADKEQNAEEIKKSLLNESDCEGDKVQDTEGIKKSLLNESDCDNDEQNSDEVNKTLLNKSGCEGEKKQDETQVNNPPISGLNCEANNETINDMFETEEKTSKVIEENELQEQIRSPPREEDTGILKSNPKDSSDDHLKTPKKRKSHSGDSPRQSKRKHMESIYAKKMLLTYSSSSETDDEQLRNTLREIRDSLLKGISSDEEVQDIKKNKKESDVDDGNTRNNESKVSSDSDNLSEEDIFKRNTVKKESFDNDSKEASCKGPTSGSISDNSNITKMGRSRATRGGSCSQNSDLLDDREIDGLTNLKSLKKTHRRRDSSSTENTQSTRSGRREMAKAGGLISNEGFLQAESSSDAVSLSGSEHADNTDGADLEEIPRVNLPDINGDGIGLLAKDELLGESDTSVSHDEKRDSKGGDDTDEENVKSKRRKQHAISSDSEAGSSRRKDHLRLSDFEDSEDESSEGPVKNKRKKKQVDSDASGTSSQDGKKKRRRIKTLDESDGSGSDTENEGRNKHGRKNIRKVMGKSQLEEATKKAAREEKERIARIAERQKLYNNLEFDESGKPDEVVLEKVVLDFDPETKEPLIQVDRGLVKKLKPHQANGIKFMWDACFESVKRIKKDKGSGCILAHCMGLGKTLQVVSLTHTLLTHAALTGVHRVLVVCPLSTVLNWVNEFRMWLKHADSDFEVDVYELSKFKQNSERAFQLSQWFEHGGVCVLGYEMFRNLSADNVKKFKKKMLKNFQESLVDPGPDLVVCDEGHLLKNEKTSLSQSMNRVKTRRRIVLTGTPLQNNLKEYYCMVQFVKPNLLGKYNEYLNRFVNPITNGQYTDSTEHDIRVMKRRSHVLHKMLDGAVQRRDYGVLAPFLPPKHEYVLFITLTEVQIKLYQHYIDNYSRQPSQGKSSGFLFPDFQSLQRIWTHPLVLKYNSERYEIMQQKKREKEEEDSEGSLRDFIDDDSTPSESSSESSSDDLSDLSDDSRKKSKKKKSPKKSKTKESKVGPRRGTRANPIDVDDEEPEEEKKENENPTEWWMKLVSEEELEDMRHSSKLVLLFDILRQCEAIGDKLLVFSQSLYSLDLIEHFLGKVDEATQEGRVDEKLGGHIGTWSPGLDYFRLDGSTSCENRSIWCKNFNMVDNPRARLFLISTRAGGLGINLVAANRVVIFDVSWNPSHDVQSIFRVYRFGQKKPCYIYRFLAMGTMEEKIYERQVTKQAISKRVIDEQQIDRHYAENDLAELYKFEPHPPVPRPIPPLPKDRLFAEMLREHEAQIYKYHEHDSLLENKEEETLSEEERKAAWEDFENEKTRPPPQPMLSPYMHNGMMGGLLAQQQQHQQMMLAALAAMVRKDMPNMNEQQIRDAVTLMYNANPAMYGGYDYGVMQKMADMYKYSQPGMMNPGMMNPAAGAGGAVGAGSMGMGGASGLQYEPPWQRQQQHQQQLRLQQLMAQQQNSMGAKYYAGGLGSRDPMAMALQQQRARELMLRPRARGRPPHSALAPPAAHAHSSAPPAPHAADVVNLDSD